MIKSSSAREIFVTLALNAVLLVALVGVFTLWQPRISANAERAALAPLLAAFPSVERHRISLQAAGTLNDADNLGLRTATPFYRVLRDDQPIGWLIPAVARQGYNGDIAVVIGIDDTGTLIGTEVLHHRETRGLGDRVERSNSDWLDSFSGRSLQNPSIGRWYVAKDGGHFDEMTGATVTSRAVTQAVRQMLLYFSRHREQFTTPVVNGADHE